jgi:lipid-A-disaccharide synthase
MRIALVAGEISGDILGAAIIEALKSRLPQARFYGVAGPRMVAAGCEAIESIDALSVMGLAEVLRELPRLFKLRAQLLQRFKADRPDLVIGIDAPDFNLGLERRLRDAGLRTVHVVSPTVWAWREGRVKTIARAVERILCLFPFEPAFYARHGVHADYIGHPLADQLDASTTPAAARRALGLPEDGRVVTVMPGSRGGEIRYLAEPFARAARQLADQVPGLRFVTPIAKPGLRASIEAAIQAQAPGLAWTLVDGRSREAMQAGDVVLLASGTATLECLLLGRPMVVAYRASALTAWLMLRLGLLKTRYVSLPNLLAAEPTVAELLQDQAHPECIATELRLLLDDGEPRRRQLRQFDAVRSQLRCGAADRAAAVIAELLGAR